MIQIKLEYIFTIFDHFGVISCLNVISLKSTFVNLRRNIFLKDVLSAWCKLHSKCSHIKLQA